MENMENKEVETVETVEAEVVEEVVEEVIVEEPIAEEAPAKKNVNVLAIISLVAGILGIIFNCCCGILSIPCGIGAFILALVAPKNENGKRNGMAIAGLILGILAVVVYVVSLIISFIFPAFTSVFAMLMEETMY